MDLTLVVERKKEEVGTVFLSAKLKLHLFSAVNAIRKSSECDSELEKR